MLRNSQTTFLIAIQLFVGILIVFGIQTEDGVTDDGKASFYHDKFHGRLTSNGEIYDKNDFTAAHRSLPFNSIVHVSNKRNGKSVIVRINDRGPFVRSRIIDLSRSAAQKIEMVPYGVVPVTIRVMTLFDNVPLDDSIFIKDDIWDCYGKLMTLNENSLLVWITENWKHAFYVASKLSLDNHLEGVGVRVIGPIEHRTYDVIISSIKNKSDSDSLLYVLKKQGYTRAHEIK